LDERRLRGVVLAQEVDEAVDAVTPVRRQRPGGARYRARVAVCEAAEDDGQGLVVDQAAEKLDVFHCLALVGRGERLEDLRHCAIAELAELLERLLRVRRGRICFLSNPRDQPIGLERGYEIHRPTEIDPKALALS